MDNKLMLIQDDLERVELTLKTIHKFANELFNLVKQCRSEIHKVNIVLDTLNKCEGNKV